MLKKRVIFTLLHENGHFYLSRNFRLQKVGNVRWLKRNYNFSKIAYSIDELVILDVSRGQRDLDKFCSVVKSIAEDIFVPIAAGGGIRTLKEAQQILSSGADKIVLNTLLFDEPSTVVEISQQFGRQAIIGSVDCKYADDKGVLDLFVENGNRHLDISFEAALQELQSQPVGELYLNSIDRDGTGFGYDTHLLEKIPQDLEIPLILAGGAGKGEHLAQGLDHPAVDAVATAHLFNFVGDGLKSARQFLLDKGYDLARWDLDILSKLKD